MNIDGFPGNCQVGVLKNFGMSFDDISWEYPDVRPESYITPVDVDKIVSSIEDHVEDYSYIAFLATTTTTQRHAEEALRKCGFKVIKQVTAYSFKDRPEQREYMENIFGWLPEDMEYKHTFWFATRKEIIEAING